MKTAIATVAAVALAGLVAASAARAQTCVGDCGNDGMVSISDLITGVNIALGSLPVSACSSFACQGGDTVPINCLIQGVNNALGSCTVGPTPTATPGGTLEMRIFTVDPGGAGAGEGTCMTGTPSPCIQDSDCANHDCDATATGLFTSALSNTTAILASSPGPFKLALGPADANGVRALTLAEDASFGLDIVNSTCLCLKFKAAGSTGSIDCDGGTPYDTSITQPTGPGTAWTIQTGLGSAAGPGNGNLIVTGLFLQWPDFCSTVDCSDETIYTDPPNQFPFTTTIATAFKGTLNLSDHGAPFDCANFTTSGSGGILACGVAETVDPVGDTANVLRFSENP